MTQLPRATLITTMQLTDMASGKYIVAVSGGVDSVVLLDILSKQKDLELVVAHLDHGIRETSHTDASFVKELAEKYGLPFVSERIELGESASEEAARKARQAFLQKVKKEHRATAIITAHHADDILETIIINIIRGTGWRGLSSLRSEKEYVRPLLRFSKNEIYEHAKKNNLSWREDETNIDTRYLRNHVRLNIISKLSSEVRKELLMLYHRQVALREEIYEEVKHVLGLAKTNVSDEYDRYFFIMLDKPVALELLKHIIPVTKPQLLKMLLAIKTAKQHTHLQIGGGIKLYFTKRTFIVARPDIMVS